MLAEQEIGLLRHSESRIQAQSEDADRCIAALLPHFACNFVIADSVAFRFWCRLPWNWQCGIDEPVRVRQGRPPAALRGPVGVSLETLRWLASDV